MAVCQKKILVLLPPDQRRFSPARELTQKGLLEMQAPLLSGSKPENQSAASFTGKALLARKLL